MPELVRLDAELVAAEHVMRHGHETREYACRAAIAKRLELVERQFGVAAQKIQLHVADRDAILERQAAVNRRQQQPALRQHADQCECKTISIVDEEGIARIGVLKRGQVALARDHRNAGDPYQFPRVRGSQSRDAPGRSPRFLAQFRPRASKGTALCMQRKAVEAGRRALRRRAPGLRG